MRSLVVKVGGSLYDWPELGQRLRSWLEQHLSRVTLLVPGGGRTADGVREWDRVHGLGEEKAHWLALRALTLNAHFLANLLPGAQVTAEPRQGFRDQANALWILDAHAFALADDRDPEHLPHTWTATSDSLAARVAIAAGADALVLLKSVTLTKASQGDWREAARLGLVDELFPELVGPYRETLAVSAVNLREWRP